MSTNAPFYALIYFVFYMYNAREHRGLALYKLIDCYYEINEVDD